MGACPYCRSTSLPGDTICYSCGRVLPKGDRASYRLEQQFSKTKGKKDTTYKMAAKPSQRGVVQTHTGRQRNIMKRRKNRFRSVAMLGLVAFIMLSPQAQEAVFGEFGGVEEFLQSQLAPYHVYPNEATYTLSKISEVTANGESTQTENILIPPVVQSSLLGAAQFAYTDGSEDLTPSSLQQTLQITLVIDGQDINVPIDGMPDRPYTNAISTPSGHEVWWPSVGEGTTECPIAKCIKVRTSFQNGGTARYEVHLHMQSTSYAWWDDSSRVDARVEGRDIGINAENSGTFDDLAQRGNGVRQGQFGNSLWYDRGPGAGFAINAQDAIVMATADAIAAHWDCGQFLFYKAEEVERVFAVFEEVRDYWNANEGLHDRVRLQFSDPQVRESGDLVIATVHMRWNIRFSVDATLPDGSAFLHRGRTMGGDNHVVVFLGTLDDGWKLRGWIETPDAAITYMRNLYFRNADRDL